MCRVTSHTRNDQVLGARAYGQAESSASDKIKDGPRVEARVRSEDLRVSRNHGSEAEFVLRCAVRTGPSPLTVESLRRPATAQDDLDRDHDPESSATASPATVTGEPNSI